MGDPVGHDAVAKTAKAIVWPLVALAALLIFRSPITAALPDVKTIAIGSLTIEKGTPLAQQADSAVLNALQGLTQTSISALITRSLEITCFYQAPRMEAQPIRVEHAQLIAKGLLEEMPAAELATRCSDPNPLIGLRRTALGERARTFQLRVLEELSRASR